MTDAGWRNFFLEKNKKNEKQVLTSGPYSAIMHIVEPVSGLMVRGSVGIGRRARLRILWPLGRVGSSPIFRIQRV